MICARTLRSSDAEIEKQAKTVRARLDEAIQRAQARFPVYLVFTHPPHPGGARPRASPVPERVRAHVEHELDLAHWLAACLRMLRPGGSLTLIHRAERLADALAPLRGPLGDLIVYPLWPRAGDRPAKRVLVQGRKGSRGPLRLARGLVLHDERGGFSAAAEAVLRHAHGLVPLDPRDASGDG